jgi:hypothetical protein
MLGLFLRREQLPLPVRHALFAKLANHLERRLGVARPAYFSEERFVLNLASIALSRDGELPTVAGTIGGSSGSRGPKDPL